MNIKIFADGADLVKMRELDRACPVIAGFTTNPTLMKKAGVTDYRAFAREALEIAVGRPVSFEVVADDFAEMRRQAHEIASWGPNAYVKIPVTDTRGNSSVPLLRDLTAAGVRLNVTAMFTAAQAAAVLDAVEVWPGSVVLSLFA